MKPGRILISLVVVGALAGASGAGATGKQKRWAPQKWKAALSQPRYDSVDSSLHKLTAEDGAVLTLTLHLPGGLQRGKKIPTLLEITPYQPLDARVSGPVVGTDGPTNSWRFFVERGAAYVQADARGTGGSEGCLDFGGSIDRSDAKIFTDWIRKQEWSDGVVVTDGISHPGMGSVVAHAADPKLTGALAHAPVVSYYQDEWLQGAKFEDQFNGPAYQAIELAPSAYLDPDALKNQAAACTGKTTADFSVYDGPFVDLWADRDLSRHTPRSRTPILITHGFVDLNVHPDHMQLYWDALPDDYPKYLISGYWYHGWPDMGGHPFLPFESVRHRWLDTLLFGRENGLWLEPRVLIEDSTGVWHEGHDWPLEPSTAMTLYPSASGGLGGASKRGEVTYVDEAGAERGAWENAGVAFRSAPLKSERLVNGAPLVDLVASSDQTSTKWVAYLMDEAPDGSWERISHGYADSHLWGPEDEWRDLEPGKKYHWRIELMPSAVRVAKGHRLTLVIASQDSSYNAAGCMSDYRGGCYSPSGIAPALTMGRATNTVYVGRGATRIRFFWVDPARTQKPPWMAGA